MSRLTSVVLPAPVGPTMATVWPGSTVRDTCSISGRSAAYRKHTAWNSTPPVTEAGLGGPGGVGVLLARVQQREHPLRRGDARLQQVGHARDLGQWLAELP